MPYDEVRARWKTMVGRIAVNASQTYELRGEQKSRAIKTLRIMPGMDKAHKPEEYGWRIDRVGLWNADYLIETLDTSDSRVIWNSIHRHLSVEDAANREQIKMAKANIEGSAALNDLDYILLNVSRNLWVAPDSQYTKEPGEALVLKRLPALDQFVEACKANNGDYNVPVRLQDLVACSMGLDE